MANVTEPPRADNLAEQPFRCPIAESGACSASPGTGTGPVAAPRGDRKYAAWTDPTRWLGALGVAIVSTLIVAGCVEVIERTSVTAHDSSIVVTWR